MTPVTEKDTTFWLLLFSSISASPTSRAQDRTAKSTPQTFNYLQSTYWNITTNYCFGRVICELTSPRVHYTTTWLVRELAICKWLIREMSSYWVSQEMGILWNAECRKLSGICRKSSVEHSANDPLSLFRILQPKNSIFPWIRIW